MVFLKKEEILARLQDLKAKSRDLLGWWDKLKDKKDEVVLMEQALKEKKREISLMEAAVDELAGDIKRLEKEELFFLMLHPTSTASLFRRNCFFLCSTRHPQHLFSVGCFLFLLTQTKQIRDRRGRSGTRTEVWKAKV